MHPSSDRNSLSFSLLVFLVWFFPLFFPCDGYIMGYHDGNLLRLAVKLDSLTTPFLAIRAGFFLFVWPLRGVLLGVFLEYFVLFCRVPGAMHQESF